MANFINYQTLYSNSIHEAPVLYGISDKEIPFLNKLIKRDKNEIWMDLYRKLTDT